MITKDNLENVLDFLGFVQDEPGQWERRYPESGLLCHSGH